MPDVYTAIKTYLKPPRQLFGGLDTMMASMMTSPIEELLAVMRTLRDPEMGCPWDKKQTFSSIAPYTLEETYEVLDAIQRADYPDLKGELGDLLFQVVFHAQIASEQGLFDFDEVCQAISEKLIRRHPHVFSPEAAAENDPASRAGWEKIKSAEREEKSLHSVLDDIPEVLPALLRAHKIQQRCAAVGFDWHELQPVLDKVYEEIDEVMQEVRQAPIDEERLTEELGDMLFAVVNFTRHLGRKSEMVLQQANRKFERRFRQVEQYLRQSGIRPAEASLEQMEALWQQVKQAESDQG